VWDAQTGEEVREPIKADNWDYSHISLAWAPDGHHVATSSLTGRARLFDLDSGEAVFTTEPIHDITAASGYSHWLMCLAYSPDGRHIALGQFNGAIIVRDAHTGELIHNWKKAHEGELESIGYSPDGSRIVTAGLDQTIKVWDAATGAQLFTLKGHRACVDSVAYSPDGRLIVSGDREGSAKVWEADGSREWVLRAAETNEIASVDRTSLAADSLRTFNTTHLVFSPDGRRFVSGTWATRTRLRVLSMRDIDSGRPLWSHPAVGPHAAFFPDGRKLVAAQGSDHGWDSTDARLVLLDAETGKIEREFEVLEGSIEMIAVSHDGRRVYSTASARRGSIFQIWDSQTGHEIDHRDLEARVDEGGPVAVSPDDRRLAFGTKNLVSVADLDTGRLVFKATNSAQLVSLAWSPDAKRIATGDWAHAVTIWDAETGQKIVSMLGHVNGVTSLNFSRDGQRLLSSSFDNTARLWDTGTGRELLMYKGPSAAIYSGAIAPNGRTLLLGGVFNWMSVIASATPEDVARWEREERDAAELRRAEQLKN
jgi:WD40 repeat protein